MHVTNLYWLKDNKLIKILLLLIYILGINYHFLLSFYILEFFRDFS